MIKMIDGETYQSLKHIPEVSTAYALTNEETLRRCRNAAMFDIPINFNHVFSIFGSCGDEQSVCYLSDSAMEPIINVIKAIAEANGINTHIELLPKEDSVVYKVEEGGRLLKESETFTKLVTILTTNKTHQRRFSIIPLHLELASGIHHTNMLVVDHKMHKIFHFEPLGCKSGVVDSMGGFAENFMRKFVQHINTKLFSHSHEIIIQSPYEIIQPVRSQGFDIWTLLSNTYRKNDRSGPQLLANPDIVNESPKTLSVEEMSKHQNPSGLSAAWSWLMAYALTVPIRKVYLTDGVALRHAGRGMRAVLQKSRSDSQTVQDDPYSLDNITKRFDDFFHGHQFTYKQRITNFASWLVRVNPFVRKELTLFGNRGLRKDRFNVYTLKLVPEIPDRFLTMIDAYGRDGLYLFKEVVWLETATNASKSDSLKQVVQYCWCENKKINLSADQYAVLIGLFDTEEYFCLHISPGQQVPIILVGSCGSEKHGTKLLVELKKAMLKFTHKNDGRIQFGTFMTTPIHDISQTVADQGNYGFYSKMMVMCAHLWCMCMVHDKNPKLKMSDLNEILCAMNNACAGSELFKDGFLKQVASMCEFMVCPVPTPKDGYCVPPAKKFGFADLKSGLVNLAKGPYLNFDSFQQAYHKYVDPSGRLGGSLTAYVTPNMDSNTIASLLWAIGDTITPDNARDVYERLKEMGKINCYGMDTLAIIQAIVKKTNISLFKLWDRQNSPAASFLVDIIGLFVDTDPVGITEQLFKGEGMTEKPSLDESRLYVCTFLACCGLNSHPVDTLFIIRRIERCTRMLLCIRDLMTGAYLLSHKNRPVFKHLVFNTIEMLKKNHVNSLSVGYRTFNNILRNDPVCYESVSDALEFVKDNSKTAAALIVCPYLTPDQKNTLLVQIGIDTPNRYFEVLETMREEDLSNTRMITMMEYANHYVSDNPDRAGEFFKILQAKNISGEFITFDKFREVMGDEDQATQLYNAMNNELDKEAVTVCGKVTEAAWSIFPHMGGLRFKSADYAIDMIKKTPDVPINTFFITGYSAARSYTKEDHDNFNHALRNIVARNIRLNIRH